MLATTGAVTAFGVWLARGGRSKLRRQFRQGARTLDRRRRYLDGKVQGWRYHRAWREPAPDVPDQVLVDRIRSTLGPLEKRLDVPHLHVTIEGRTAILHGEVPTEDDAAQLIDAVAQVAGVQAVRSHLRVGLIRGDTRPSEGRRPATSTAMRQLVDAARTAGAPQPEQAVGGVLRVLAGRLPPAEHDQLLSHLPADVRRLADGGRRRRWRRLPPVKTVDEFDARVAEEGRVPHVQADRVAREVLGVLHTLAPEEDAGVSAVLPAEIRRLWQETSRSA